MKKTILLRAPLLTQSGYGVHSRQVARWLFDYADRVGNIEIHTELLNWGQTPWLTNVYEQSGLIGRIFQASYKKLDKYDVSIQLQLPNEWCEELADINIGITAGVEADRVNPEWINCVNKMSLVIVPSEYSKKAFSNTGPTTTEICVIPESYFDELENISSIEPLGLNPETKFNFLIFGQFTSNVAEEDRKNLGYTLKWLCEEFQNDSDVGIILKTNLGRNSEIDKQFANNMLVKLLDQVSVKANPKIYLLHGEMSNLDIAKLYKEPSIKGFVTLTHGEGFGLPILESAVAKIPIIASNYSAHTEYLKLGKFIPIETKSSPVPAGRIDNQIFMPGAQWGEPSEVDFKNKIRKFYKSSEIPKQWAIELSEKLTKNYCFDSISSKYTELLGKFL